MRPIVFVHIGNQRYLKKTIHLAQKNNKNVFLIGDNSNRFFCRQWCDYRELNQELFERFEEKYVHLSTNKYEFEQGCFKRYFLLYEFMKENDFEECFMVDSDVCIYFNLEDEDLCGYDVALSATENGMPNIWCMSPHCSYWKITTLKDFLNYLICLYEDIDAKLSRIWNYYLEHHMYGGVSDMVTLHLWVKEKKVKWLNLAVATDGNVFDDNISSQCNYRNQIYQQRSLLRTRKIKRIKFVNRIPYFYEMDTDKMIASKIIHAQGENKMYISVFAKYCNASIFYLMADIYHELTVWVCRTIKKII